MEERINSIDILRGLAIIFMIPFHFYAKWTKTNYNLLGDIIYFFGDIAAPFFLIVSGTSFFLYINKKINREIPKLNILYDAVKRALFIFTISSLFQIIFSFIFNFQIAFIIYWSIFQIIAFSMMIFFIIPFLKRFLRISLCLSLFFLIFMMNFIILFFNIEFLYNLVYYGLFPIIPWLNFFILGLLIGDLLKYSLNKREKRIMLIFSIIGSILFGFWIFWLKPITYLWISIFSISIAMFFILLAVVHYYSDLKKSENILQRIIIRWSRLSLSIYYIHFGIIIVGLIIFPLIINDIYLKGFLIYQYLLIVLIFFLILELFIRIWQGFEYKFSFEWIMSKFTQKSLFSEKKN
jgi:peptidoglycan/LPS O-acetylase OafA/YrhL